MKVVFIVPKDDGQQSPLNQIAQCRIFPPVGLARMAGIAGTQDCVSLVDERIDSPQQDLQAHLAVIFINSYNRQRAYTLAKLYQQLGSYVVFTGPLLNNNPQEACHFSDCLFIGDGVKIMPDFLSDFRRGKKRRIYGNTDRKPATSQTAAAYGNAVLQLV